MDTPKPTYWELTREELFLLTAPEVNKKTAAERENLIEDMYTYFRGENDVDEEEEKTDIDPTFLLREENREMRSRLASIGYILRENYDTRV